MTPAQQEMRDYIARFQFDQGRTPGYQEMADHFGISRGNAHDRVSRLVALGYVRRCGHRIEILPDVSVLSIFTNAEIEAELHSRNALARAA